MRLPSKGGEGWDDQVGPDPFLLTRCSLREKDLNPVT